MFRTRPVIAFTLALGVLLLGDPVAQAGETRVAVAANFTAAAQDIGVRFAAISGHKPVFSFGSTGQLYTQISHGAPFDIFLAADQSRAEKAVALGLAVADSRFTYARGRIALFSRDTGLITGEDTLRSERFSRLAIASPITAPYGMASVEAMRTLGVYDQLVSRIVRGANIAQTYQFVATGNAEVGFVALSQVAGHQRGSRWIVPDTLYTTIAQDAVLLKRGATNEAAQAFIAFLRGSEARAVMGRYGYGAGS